MSLFMVLTLWGQVGLSVGPLPDDMGKCVSLAEQSVQQVDTQFAKSVVQNQNGRLVWRSDIAIGCGYFPERPVGGSTIDMSALTRPAGG